MEQYKKNKRLVEKGYNFRCAMSRKLEYGKERDWASIRLIVTEKYRFVDMYFWTDGVWRTIDEHKILVDAMRREKEEIIKLLEEFKND